MRQKSKQTQSERTHLSKQKKESYNSICLGSMKIAQNFLRLSEKYLNALISDTELCDVAPFTCKNLPPNYIFCLNLAMDIYDRLNEENIDIGIIKKDYTSVVMQHIKNLANKYEGNINGFK